MKILIENIAIKLAYAQAQDIPFVMAAEQENAKYIGQWTYEQHANALHDPDILHLVVQDSGGKNVGFVIIRGLTNEHDNIELMRIVIVEKGFGYGQMALALVKKWCFEIQKAHRLWLDVRDHNERAQHVYESQGFIREGLFRECVKVGDKFESLIIMSVLEQDYRAV